MTAAGLLAVAVLGSASVAGAQEEAAPVEAAPAEEAPAEAAAETTEAGLSESDKLSAALGYVMAQQAGGAFEGGVDVDAFVRGLVAAQAQEPSNEDLSFAIGVMSGLDLSRRAEVTVNPELFAQAMKAALAGEPNVISDQEMGLTLAMFQQRQQMLQQQRQQEQQAAQQAAAAEALAVAAAYMEEAKTAEGVTVTDSGLVYKVVKMGDGPKPTQADTVKVHYEGRFTDGEVFDSSYRRGEPTEFPLNGVVPGFSEGIALMPVGSEFELTLPPDLNYGPGGPRPNSVMIFKVELIDIVTPDAMPAIQPPPAE